MMAPRAGLCLSPGFPCLSCSWAWSRSLSGCRSAVRSWAAPSMRSDQPKARPICRGFRARARNSMAAVVIGGTSLLGGAGSAIGPIFGAMILGVISFFFRIFDIAPLLQRLFEGLILLAAVSIGALGVLRVKNTLELFR